jgi:hypothetical protein
MSQDKVLKIYSKLTLEDKERLLNILLGDSYIYCHSDKRHMGFEFEADDMFACTNGTRLQINVELDKASLCSISKPKKVKFEGDWSKVKLNSFSVPLSKQERKGLN